MRLRYAVCIPLALTFSAAASSSADAKACLRYCAWYYPEFNCNAYGGNIYECYVTKKTCGKFAWACTSNDVDVSKVHIGPMPPDPDPLLIAKSAPKGASVGRIRVNKR